MACFAVSGPSGPVPSPPTGDRLHSIRSGARMSLTVPGTSSLDGQVKGNRRTRQASKLPPLRWTSYAIAAGATAAGAIATAEAEIHYSGPVDYKFQGRSTVKSHKFPLSNGAYLIGAINHVRSIVNYDYAYCGVSGARVSNSVRGPGNVGMFCRVAALPGRSVVSAGDFTIADARTTMQDGDCSCSDWQDRGTYYVGF